MFPKNGDAVLNKISQLTLTICFSGVLQSYNFTKTCRQNRRNEDGFLKTSVGFVFPFQDSI